MLRKNLAEIISRAVQTEGVFHLGLFYLLVLKKFHTYSDDLHFRGDF